MCVRVCVCVCLCACVLSIPFWHVRPSFAFCSRSQGKSNCHFKIFCFVFLFWYYFIVNDLCGKKQKQKHLNTSKVKNWLSEEGKGLSKWNKRHFSFFQKCSFRYTKQISKNVAHTTFNTIWVNLMWA